MQINLPIYLTLFRIIITPFLILMFYLPFNWSHFLCLLVFIVSSLTDLFDGFLSRKRKQVTNIGIFLDPIADKILIITMFILFIDYFHSYFVTLPILMIIIREIIVSSLREWIRKIKNQSSLPVFLIGKIKTTIHTITLITLLWNLNEKINLVDIIALYISFFFSFFSMFQYLYYFKKNF